MKYLIPLFFLLLSPNQDTFYSKLSDAALLLTKDHVIYDGSYCKIPYPNGDVAKNRGVCTDVVIRAYRKLGIDLQKEVHEDMKANFSKYPKIWGLKHTDTNIDHRRVPNLETFFTRKGTVLPVTKRASDYKPGDIVSWRLPGGLPHIGIVVNKKSTDGKRYKLVHNIGRGQELEDCIFNYTITGHYRYKKQT
ncbi:DUF1287 domain-containing protein [Flavobacterium litorale]|uniref:DUF1287 domain-containing protein n=1 Tax=Flavobacterium litorale TaxID=2856519 RepID=A0ABX8V519_9FLAO|nr:DUF1287 domain-containing protein [Flavobacterium litorale]QYJ67223.1 DUF1287 domain-containing protein [Flavobacterium litorale]